MDSNVDYQTVRRACCNLMGRGERPSRPNVQDLLNTKEYLGHKGSNAVVQGYINDFWVEVGQRLNEPPRTVAGVPDAFVSIIDKALVDMVSAARNIAESELAGRKEELAVQAQKMEVAVQEARDSALAADQLRLRAEGELNAVQARVNELRGNLASTEQRLVDESRRNEAQARTIEEKDAEIRRHFDAIEAANRALEQANERHRDESHRLLKQVDDERQSGRKEAQRLNNLLEKARSETTEARNETTSQREENARIKSENAALAANKSSLEASVADLNGRLANAEQTLRRAQEETTVLRIRYETAEQLRQEASGQCTTQAEELGELRRTIEQLESDLAVARAAQLRSEGDLKPPR
jgi:chromosome segregation ATPase